jgi:membrane protease YdiL (CAAX protease family)
MHAHNSRNAWINLLATYGTLAAFFGITAGVFLRRYQLGIAQVVSIYFCLIFLVALFLAPGFEVSRSWLARRLKGLWWAAGCIALFLVPYLIYAAGTDDFRWIALGKLGLMASLPFGLFAAMPVKHPLRMNWQDVVVLLWLVLPMLFRRIGQIWNVPLNLDFMVRMFIGSVAAWAFILWRGLEGVGYDFHFTWVTIRAGLVNLAALTIIVLPLSLGLRFSAWNPQWHGPMGLLFDCATIFIFIAVPEELLFRGILQNLLEKTWNSRYSAQMIASMLFGFFHIMIAPVPNWRYVILATVAGWFYGSAYRTTGSLMASATTHTLVDIVRRVLFFRAIG